MMEMIQAALAKFLDSFKAKNPTVYLLIVLALMTVIYIAENAIGIGLLAEGQLPWLPNVLEIVSQVLIVITGSRTVKFIASPKDSPAQLRSNPDYND